MNPLTPALSAGDFRSGKPLIYRIIEFFINSAVLYYISCCLLLYGVHARFPAPAPTAHVPWELATFLAKYYHTYGIFLLYVIILTSLCLLVLRRLSLLEDGLVMAGMVLLLILDPAFFNNVFYTFGLRLGLQVNSFCFALSIALFVVLVTIGRLPCTKRSAAVAVLAAAFVYFYPVGLSAELGWKDGALTRYFYLLWWMPLLVVTVCEVMPSPKVFASKNFGESSAVIPDASQADAYRNNRMRHRFLIAGILIVFYIVLSHLLEANYAYDLEYRPEYFTPISLAIGLLLFKLSPAFRNSEFGHAVLWICPLVAVWLSLSNMECLTINLPHEIPLSPFRYSFIAAALYSLYLALNFRKTTHHRSWVVAAIASMFLAVSGSSLPEAIFNIFRFHFIPYFFLFTAFAIWSLVERAVIFPRIAGGSLLIALLSLTPFQGVHKAVLFSQAWAIWLAFVHWLYYRYDRHWLYSLMGTFVFSLSVLVCFYGSPRLAWRTDYVVVIAVLACCGRFLENKFLSALALLGILAGPLYLGRHQISTFVSSVCESTLLQRLANPGVLTTLLAFLLLPLAYFLSVLKKRRRFR